MFELCRVAVCVVSVISVFSFLVRVCARVWVWFADSGLSKSIAAALPTEVGKGFKSQQSDKIWLTSAPILGIGHKMSPKMNFDPPPGRFSSQVGKRCLCRRGQGGVLERKSAGCLAQFGGLASARSAQHVSKHFSTFHAGSYLPVLFIWTASLNITENLTNMKRNCFLKFAVEVEPCERSWFCIGVEMFRMDLLIWHMIFGHRLHRLRLILLKFTEVPCFG